jgi:hypothetical protein
MPPLPRRKNEAEGNYWKEYDMLIVPQHSGHTIFSRHIEEPAREFFVAWDAPAYVNVLRFEAGRRWARVLGGN